MTEQRRKVTNSGTNVKMADDASGGKGFFNQEENSLPKARIAANARIQKM